MIGMVENVLGIDAVAFIAILYARASRFFDA
jgi:hypothetical protein